MTELFQRERTNSNTFTSLSVDPHLLLHLLAICKGRRGAVGCTSDS